MMSLIKGNMDQSPMVIGAVILLLDLWIVYGTIVSTQSIAYKLACTLIMSMFPFGGLLLYLPMIFLSAS
ncbi:MAG: hypothetical protein EXX96DRAFT_580169 [Benjaminiella poitrasii]|nr:MAG: hypothetical protein EXX96DRAFT_580169 [Benjaminiella poitrasii]